VPLVIAMWANFSTRGGRKTSAGFGSVKTHETRRNLRYRGSVLRRAVAVAVAATLALSAGALRSAGGTGVPATPATVGAGALVFSGHGWGHAVGMSQWGAYGYAKHGWTYDAILAHYYPGTTLGPAPVSKLRALLVENAKSVRISSDAPWTLRDTSGAVEKLDAGKLVLGPALKVRLPASATATQLSQPVTFVPGKAPLQVAGKPYRGTVQISVVKGRLQVVNLVALEGYVKGVVPSEMPSDWVPEALKAQAVAARTYALFHRSTTGAFDVYSDVRDQVYGGIAAESPAASAAVDATKGRVVLSAGKVADTLFSSSSGGRTAAASEVFKSATFAPYLVSVSDPYDTASPYHDWGPTPVDVNAAGKKLGLKGRVTDVPFEFWASGRVKSATATGPAPDATVTVTGSSLRSLLGLRSTWLTGGLLTLSRPYGPLTYGSSIVVSGVARDAGDASVEQRTATPFWSPAPPVAPDGDGAFSFTVKPFATTEYRLVAAALKAPALRVPVAPFVRVAAPTDRLGLRGTTKPVVAGRSVEVQRLDWVVCTPVAQAPVDAKGAFAATFDLVPGTYRARYAPGNGLVAGTSPQLVVS
jgi:stage II sporulation protein D